MEFEQTISDHFVSIDGGVVQMLLSSFGIEEKKVLAESWHLISESVADIFEDMSYEEIMSTRGGDLKAFMQDVFCELEKIIPYYVPMLRSNMDFYGDETYMDMVEVTRELKIDSAELRMGFFPKLHVSDGSRGFALAQTAAYKAGVPDDNLRFWYLVLAMFLESHLYYDVVQ
jgi:hypothetical protein